MTEIWDYPRALRELWNRSSYERGLISDPFGDTARAELGLRRMRALLGELDNPEARVSAVHVAGSKGKGSTAGFVALAAQEAGYRVGLYTSPHLHRFPERIALDSQPLPDDQFASVAEIVSEAARAVERQTPELDTITTFEFITAMAFTAFARAGCQLSVIEVGLGGLYDATNVLSPLVSVITRIDFEHTAVLGSTLAAIATQKAGIIRPQIPVVSSPQLPEAKAAIAHVAHEMQSPILFGNQDWRWRGSWRAFDAEGPWGAWHGLSLGVPGPHQIENASTALAALHLLNASALNIPEAAIRAALANSQWPGRFEQRRLGGREVVFDGAHTPAAAAALVDTWRSELGADQATVILGMGADKNVSTFLQSLRPLIGQLIATRADSPRAADPAIVAETARGLGLSATVQPSVAEAIASAIATNPGPLLITGSLFVAGEGREAFGLASPDLIWRQLNAPHDRVR